MKKVCLKLLLFSLFFTLISCENDKKVDVPATSQEALEALIEGNKRYVEGSMIHPNCDMKRVKETAPHQDPFAAVVGCSDSRVPVEIVFDQGVGDIFVIRTAGNNIDGKMIMGSIEYAVDHLGVKVLLVLGHGSCGGVTSAITGGAHHGEIGKLLHCIQEDIPEYIGKTELLDEAIRHHADVQIEEILSNELIKEKVDDGELIVKAAYYNINTGVVEIQ